MKTKNLIYILSILLVFISCKKTNLVKGNEEKNNITQIDSVHKTNTQNDIYINNEFNGMTELVDVKALEFEETSIDSIWYGFYNIRNTEAYIFSINKFLRNPDVEQYRTIDTVNLKSKNIEVKVEKFSDYKTLNLLQDKKVVKKWKFKNYPKKEKDNINGDIVSKTKITSILNNWQNDNIEIHITTNGISYLFHGQCAYAFPVKILNEKEVELIWGETGKDCVYDVQFNKTFGLSKEKIPQKGKPFAKYILEKDVVNVTYYYKEWVKSYKEQINVKPFMDAFSIKE